MDDADCHRTDIIIRVIHVRLYEYSYTFHSVASVMPMNKKKSKFGSRKKKNKSRSHFIIRTIYDLTQSVYKRAWDGVLVSDS